MSKLKVKQVLAETKLSTDKYGVKVKIVPVKETEVEIQFGHYGPAPQIATVEDIRELADIFLEVAELLEGGEKTQKKVTKPEEKRTISVKLSTNDQNSTLHEVFNGLTDKQAKELRRVIMTLDTMLPQGMRFWTPD